MKPRDFVTSCCTKCGKPKNKDDFYAEKRNRDGLRSVCKKCNNIVLDKEKKQNSDKARYERNKEKLNEYQREWRRNNKDKWAVRQALRCRIKSFIKRMGSKKHNKTTEIIGCNFEALKLHLEKQFLKNMSWENYGKWHIDHIVPLSKAKGLEEMYKLCHYTNLRPLWAKDNLQKSNKAIYLI